MLRKIIPISGMFIICACGGEDITFDDPITMDGGVDVISISSNNGGNNTSANKDGGVIPEKDRMINSQEDSGEEEFDSGKNEPDAAPPINMDSGTNDVDSGGNNSGGNSSGDANGNNNNCQPKNCLDIAFDLTGNTEEKACGVVDDGCGNLIDCGGCPGVNKECGAQRFVKNNQSVEKADGIENICGGGCANDVSLNTHCFSENEEYPKFFVCHSIAGEVLPPENTECLTNQMFGDDVWCCK